MESKINSEVMKSVNKNRILRLIRDYSCSRSELSRRTGLTRAAVSFICEQLVKDGLVTEGEKSQSSGGRRAVELKINGKFGVVGGINFTRTEYIAGVVDFAGNLLGQIGGRVSTPQNTLREMAEELKKILPANSRLLGIGITAPGPLDRQTGKLKEVANFSSWRNQEVSAYFQKFFNCSVVLDNVSNALALAEYRFNPACREKYLELIIDSGFGSAVIDLRDGVKLIECELGHTTVNMQGKRCDCGNIGCVELYVNMQKFYSGEHEKVQFYSALASVIVNAVNCYGVKQIIFSGEVDLQKVNEELKRLVAERMKEAAPELLLSALNNKNVFVAANLWLDAMKV